MWKWCVSNLISPRRNEVSALQEKTGQIALGNNMPLLWAQQLPPYEQLTQEENVSLTGHQEM